MDGWVDGERGRAPMFCIGQGSIDRGNRDPSTSTIKSLASWGTQGATRVDREPRPAR